jgi:hypothetical protein
MSAAADSWSSSGYLTLQNNINTYLANVQAGTQGTADEFSVETFLQRYPKVSPPCNATPYGGLCAPVFLFVRIFALLQFYHILMLLLVLLFFRCRALTTKTL